MKILAIVWANVLRTLRDRTALFFSVVLPFILIMVLGLSSGSGQAARVGVVDGDGGSLATQLVDAVAAAQDLRIDVARYATLEELRDAASRGDGADGLRRFRAVTRRRCAVANSQR